jgi:hypothetical protein
MATAPPPARQRFNPRGRAEALPSSYTTNRDTTRVGHPGRCPLRRNSDEEHTGGSTEIPGSTPSVVRQSGDGSGWMVAKPGQIHEPDAGRSENVMWTPARTLRMSSPPGLVLR